MLSIRTANISVNGLFVNTDSDFDSKELRSKCYECRIIPNIIANPKDGNSDQMTIFDDMLYEWPYTIERTNTLMDIYRMLLS